MTLGFFSGTLTPSQWHDGVALLQRRSGIILPSFTHYFLEGKYLFTYKIEDFTNYILLDGKSDLKKNHIYWKFERLNYFEKLNFIKDLNPDEVFILFEGLELEEKLELLEKLDGKIKNYKRPIKNYLY